MNRGVEGLAPGTQPAIRVALIDDDRGFVTVLVTRMRALEWPHRVLASPVPVEALERVRLDAVVIDPAVLGARGWEYLQALCDGLPNVGIVACTGPTSAVQRVRGLRMGVDDWVTKPCHPDEVMARVEAVVRRRRRAMPPKHDAISAGELEARPDVFEVFAGGLPADLTRREFEVFCVLAAEDGLVLEREVIYQRVWGYEMVPGDRSVDVFVRKLRAKLERVSPDWRYIHTHHGVGYRLLAERIGAPPG